MPKKHGSSSGGSNIDDGEVRERDKQSQTRLVDWIVSLMLDDIRKIVSRSRFSCSLVPESPYTECSSTALDRFTTVERMVAQSR